jgi:hypothetical protein
MRDLTSSDRLSPTDIDDTLVWLFDYEFSLILHFDLSISFLIADNRLDDFELVHCEDSI